MKQKKQKPEQKNSAMRFIWQNAKGQRYWFAVAVLCTLLGVSASFLVPQVIRFTVDSVLGNRPMRLPFSLENWFVGRSVTSSLVACAAAILVFALLAASFSFLARFCISAGTEGFARQLRNRLFRHIQRLPFHWHSEVQTGDIIQRCTSDLDVVRNFAANQLLEVVRTAMLVGVALALMLSMDVALTGIATIFIPVVGFYSIIFFSMVGKKFLAADQAEGDLMVAVQENLTGMRVVRAFGRERYEMDKFDRLNTRFTQLWLRLGRTLSV